MQGAWIDAQTFLEAYDGNRAMPEEQKAGILRSADKAMLRPIPKLTDKAVAPPSGDKRDYISLAIYWWPDETDPDAPYVRHDGRINPEKDDTSRYDAKRLQQMTKDVRALARGYAVSHDEAYAKRAVKILSTWFLDEKTRMNPSLTYAQTIPGREKGNHNGIIDTVSFIDLTDSLYLLQDSPSFPKEKQAGIKGWFSAYVKWLTTSPLGLGEKAAKNNHGVWYDAQVATYAHYTGNDALAKEILAAVPKKRLEQQLAADGSFPLELARTRPINYSMYVLRAYLTLARIGAETGVDLYDVKTSNGAGLSDAVRFLMPYVQKEKSLEKEDITPFRPKQFLEAVRLAEKTHPGFYPEIRTNETEEK